MLMKEQILRHILTSMLLFLTLQAVGKRDSLLWAGIQKVGAAYQQGALDSALVSAQRLLPLAEQHDDALTQAQLHCLVGFCLNDQGQVTNSRLFKRLRKPFTSVKAIRTGYIHPAGQ